MTTLVLDSGAVTKLAKRSKQSAATIAVLRRDGLWPPVVPVEVLVESLTGRPRDDAMTNRLLATCEISTTLPISTARRAAALRARSRCGSAVDAIVVATAEPGGTVLTGDVGDLSALASHAAGVTIEPL